MDDPSANDERTHFEGPWNRWNIVRTLMFTWTSFGLLSVVHHIQPPHLRKTREQTALLPPQVPMGTLL
jgi:hypothetical protein